MGSVPPGVVKIALKQAIKEWEIKEEALAKAEKREVKKIRDLTIVKLNGWPSPIEKMDGSTSVLIKCEQLSLSTNMIDRLSNLNSLKFLKILSVGRNYLKSLQGVEVCADTLEEIWASYNTIEKPSKGTVSCKKLRVLYLANNWIRQWDDILNLNQLPKLEEIVLVGNPLEERYTAANGGAPPIQAGQPPVPSPWQHAVAAKMPLMKKIDGLTYLRSDE